MIRFLDIVSFVLEWAYVFVFFWIVQAFLPLRQNRLIQAAAFFAFSFISTAVIYSNDLPNLLGVLLGISVYLTVFHRGTPAEKLTALLVFYPALIAVNYLMQDVGSRCFFSVTGAPAMAHKHSLPYSVLIAPAFILDPGMAVFPKISSPDHL